jgi:phenylacetic acid degradation operon negative regulatory protein
VQSGELFGIAEGTTRTAISRMVAAGELEPDGASYRLTGHLLERQARQDASRHAESGPWDGSWEMAVVVAPRRAAPQRTSLRRSMQRLKLAELREGLWVRPDNLAPDRLPADRAVVQTQCRTFRSVPHDGDAELAAELWDLQVWADEARALVSAMGDVEPRLRDGERASLRDGFLLSAAVLRHLLADPLLPAALLPSDWPGMLLRSRYEDFDAAFQAAWRGWFRDGRDVD